MLIMASGWLGKELRALRNFSIGHLNDHGHLEAGSPVMQALSELDGALTDMGTVHDTVDDERSKALLTREEAKHAVQGTSHARDAESPNLSRCSLHPLRLSTFRVILQTDSDHL